MSWTKRQIITQAFEELGLAAYVFDMSPEQLQAAVRRLDAMMAEWDALGVHVGYALGSNPDASDMDQETGLPLFANAAVYANLALRIAPGFGKVPAIELKAAAKAGYESVAGMSAMPAPRQYGGLPSGAGNGWSRNTFIPTDTAPISTDDAGQLIFRE